MALKKSKTNNATLIFTISIRFVICLSLMVVLMVISARALQSHGFGALANLALYFIASVVLGIGFLGYGYLKPMLTATESR